MKRKLLSKFQEGLLEGMHGRFCLRVQSLHDTPWVYVGHCAFRITSVASNTRQIPLGSARQIYSPSALLCLNTYIHTLHACKHLLLLQFMELFLSVLHPPCFPPIYSLQSASTFNHFQNLFIYAFITLVQVPQN